jgi:hypothetical protein
MNKNRPTFQIATGLVLFLFVASVQSTVLYEQATLHSSSDLGAYQYFGQELVDDFSLASGGTVGSLSWKGGYYGADNASGSESFTVHLYNDAAGTPSLTQFYSFVGTASFLATSDMRSGNTIYAYELDIADVALTSGVDYWISIFSNDSPSNYAWANSSDGSTAGFYRGSGGSWNNHSGQVRSNHVFALVDASQVPEPTTLALMGLGLAGIGFARKKKRG